MAHQTKAQAQDCISVYTNTAGYPGLSRSFRVALTPHLPEAPRVTLHSRAADGRLRQTTMSVERFAELLGELINGAG